MTILFWIVRIVVLLLLVRVVLRMFSASGRSPDREPRPSGQRRGPAERVGGTLVRDPNCGTYLPQSRAIAVRQGGDTHYFCSPACRDAFTARREPAAPVAH